MLRFGDRGLRLCDAGPRPTEGAGRTVPGGPHGPRAGASPPPPPRHGRGTRGCGRANRREGVGGRPVARGLLAPKGFGLPSESGGPLGRRLLCRPNIHGGARRVAGGEAGLEAAPGGHLQAPSKPLARVPTTQSEAREESRKQTIGEQAAGKRGEPAGVGSPGLGGRGDLAGQRQELERPGGAGSRGNQGEGTARSCVADVHGDTSRRISWSQGDRCSFVSPTFSL